MIGPVTGALLVALYFAYIFITIDDITTDGERRNNG